MHRAISDFTTANLITQTIPTRYQTEVLTNSTISVTFLRDMDTTTFSDSTLGLQVFGVLTRVPITWQYFNSNKTLVITPSGGLLPNTTYQMNLQGDPDPTDDAFTSHISGLKDITGNGFTGSYSWAFTTSNLGVPDAPSLLSPINQVAIGTQPTFVWTGVTAANYYDIQVSKTNTFEQIYWPVGNVNWNQASTQVTPSTPFDFNTEYWWRVRSVTLGASGLVVPGGWSNKTNFYFGDPTGGVVTPDDIPIGVIAPTPVPLTVLYANPAPAASNLQLNDLPAQISVVLNNAINLAGINDSSLTLEGKAIDGVWTAGAFAPIFVPSLNGSQFGGGGIVIPAPVDEYQQILVSGKLDGVQPSAQFDGTNTTISLNVPPTFWQNNNKYTVTLTLAELPSPLQWTFTSMWTPTFASVDGVRQLTDDFMPEMMDDDIWFFIRINSLYALLIQIYTPTRVDANWQIYQPPVSFNVNNPGNYVREYVRKKTSLDVLLKKYRQTAFKPLTQLGDLMLNPEAGSLIENLRFLITEMKLEVHEYEDFLRGERNRGYARGGVSKRGSFGTVGQDTFDFIYHPHRTRRGF